MLDGASSTSHRLGHSVKPSLLGFDHRLVFPSAHAAYPADAKHERLHGSRAGGGVAPGGAASGFYSAPAFRTTVVITRCGGANELRYAGASHDLLVALTEQMPARRPQ